MCVTAVNKLVVDAYNANLYDLSCHKAALQAATDAILEKEMLTGKAQRESCGLCNKTIPSLPLVCLAVRWVYSLCRYREYDALHGMLFIRLPRPGKCFTTSIVLYIGVLEYYCTAAEATLQTAAPEGKAATWTATTRARRQCA